MRFITMYSIKAPINWPIRHYMRGKTKQVLRSELEDSGLIAKKDDLKKIVNKVKNSAHDSNEVIDKSPENLRSTLIEFPVLQKRLKRSRICYLLNHDHIEEVAGAVIKSSQSQGQQVILSSPGPSKLLDSFITMLDQSSLLTIMQPKGAYLSQVKSCSEAYPMSRVVEDSYPNLFKRIFQDQEDGGNRVSQWFTGFTQCTWEQNSPCKVFTILDSQAKSFIVGLVHSLVLKRPPFNLGRVTHFIFVPEIFSHTTLFASPNGKVSNYLGILMQNLFDIEVILELPRTSFYPWPLPNIHYSMEKQAYHLIKCVPKENLWSDFSNHEHLQQFLFFVKQHFSTPTSYIIPTLENWIPNCGPRLIFMGISLHTIFRDLTSAETLAIFKEFSSWPEFSCSLFKVAASFDSSDCANIANDD